MNRKNFQWMLGLMCIVSFFTLGYTPIAKRKDDPKKLQAKIELGREIFFDKNLSNPVGQSCAVCHAPRTMFSDPQNAMISEGMVDGRFVNRNSMSLMYTRYIPELHYDQQSAVWRGGLFWDGRSNTLEHQLSGPFFNPAEMNNTDTTMLVVKVKAAPYYRTMKALYGKMKKDVDIYRALVDALVAFERSEMFHPFTSKFDYFLKGEATLDQDELEGFELVKKYCNPCHSTEPNNLDGRILFTDYSYHNIGVPRNPHNPFYTTDPVINPEGENAMDHGLGAVLNRADQRGKFRVPTLRDVVYTWPYFHNGVSSDLEEVVYFKSARALGEFLPPEIEENLEVHAVGNMNLDSLQIRSIISFLHALSDGYQP